MSVNYGGLPVGGTPYCGGEAAYGPPGKVNFGWINEAWQLVRSKMGVWILAILLYGLINSLVNHLIAALFPSPGDVTPPVPLGIFVHRFALTYGASSNVMVAGQIIGALFTWVYGSFLAASLFGMAVKQVRGGVIVFADALAGGARFKQMLLLNLILFFLYIGGAAALVDMTVKMLISVVDIFGGVLGLVGGALSGGGQPPTDTISHNLGLLIRYIVGNIALSIGMLVLTAFLLPVQALVADGQPFLKALSASVSGMKRNWPKATLFVFVCGLLLFVSAIPIGLGLFVTVPMIYIIGALAYRDMVGMPNLAAGQGYSQPGYGARAASSVWPPVPSAAPLPPGGGPQ